MKLKLLPSTIPHSFPLCDSNYNASSSVHRHKFNFIVTSRSKKHHRNNHAQGSNAIYENVHNTKKKFRSVTLWKEKQKQKVLAPKPSVGYRKKKAVKADTSHDDIEDKHDDFYRDTRHNDINDADFYRILTSDFDRELGIIDTVLLVDGYNVCGHWVKLNKHFMNGELELARQMLIDELKSYSLHKDEVKVVVVFDAMMSGFPNHKRYSAGIDIVFSSETTADTWIENEVVALKKDGCPHVWVVTSDRSQQEAAIWAGAYVWSCKTLIAEIKTLQKEAEADEMLRGQRATSFHGRLLRHSLDAKVVDDLRNLRQKLAEKESKEKIKLKFQ